MKKNCNFILQKTDGKVYTKDENKILSTSGHIIKTPIHRGSKKKAAPQKEVN